MTHEYQVLDHGYLKLIESWGSDERIIEAARMSTNKGFLGWEPSTYIECVNPTCPGYSYQGIGKTEEVIQNRADRGIGMICPNCSAAMIVNKSKSHAGDAKLLRYLWTHRHTTPFEMAGLTIEIQAPIFVFREWHRHRTQSYNEMSARYTPLPNINYIPTIERMTIDGGMNKQAQSIGIGSGALSEYNADDWQTRLADMYHDIEMLYQDGLKLGIPKELARIILPVGRYSRMRASANLHNWLHFLTLRMDSHAQYEIRQYASILGRNIIATLFPRTWELFAEGLSS